MPSINSSLVFGFTSLLTYSFNSCHRFSMGLQSGDSGGVFHHKTPFASKNALAALELCLGSLSCINLHPFGNTFCTKGSRVPSRISMKRVFSIMPSKMHIPVLPLKVIPAHTCNFRGCFGLENKDDYNINCYNKETPWFRLWFLTHSMTCISLVTLHLDSCLISPDDIFKSIF